MNINRILPAALFLALTLASSAQGHRKTTVMLNDGTVIAGTIIADSSDCLKLEIKCPQVIILKKSQIKTAGTSLQVRRTDNHGYFIGLSSSLLAGKNSEGQVGSISIQLSNSYQFRSGLSLGIGTGIDNLDVLMVPLYADLRFSPFKSRVSPFVWVNCGYGFPCSNLNDGDYYLYGYYPETKGGIIFSAGSGITVWSWNHFAVSTGIGYRHQSIRSKATNTWRAETDNELVTYFNRIEVRFGISFR